MRFLGLTSRYYGYKLLHEYNVEWRLWPWEKDLITIYTKLVSTIQLSNNIVESNAYLPTNPKP
jgi:hypothetical protein